MPRNGTGTYTLPAGNPVVTGSVISSTTHNNTMSDLASEMTNSTDKDGQTVITGTWDYNGNKLILDADGDTSITASTDDIIDIEINSVDAIKLGWQGVTDTGFITVDPAAFTADTTENTHRFALLGSNAITIPTGTTPLVSSVYVVEPNITATGTVTNAVTVYIKDAPTEGASNYAVWIAAGSVKLGSGAAVTTILDEDTMSSDSATALATQQSIKAYADAILTEPVFTDYGETVNIIGSTGGGTQSIDLNLGNVASLTVDTSANTFTFDNPRTTGIACGLTLWVTNGGSQTINWPASVVWPSASAPTLTASGLDKLVFETIDGGTTWSGDLINLDYS